MVPIDSHKAQSEVEEEQSAVFTFPETLTNEDLDEETRVAANWSSTSMAAISAFLESEGKPLSWQLSDLTSLARFHVHSGPGVLRTLGKMCLKSAKYADLAVIILKEYLVAVTYQKMFTLSAGQTLDDQASVNSGYTLIRDETMLLLAQALCQLATETQGERKAQIHTDAKALVDKVEKGRNKD